MVSVAFVISMYVIVLRDKAVWNVKGRSGGGKEQALKCDEKGDRVNPSQVKFALRKYLIASKINLESRFTTSLPPCDHQCLSLTKCHGGRGGGGERKGDDQGSAIPFQVSRPAQLLTVTRPITRLASTLGH